MSARTVPLLVASPERLVTHVEVTLPNGQMPTAPAEPVHLESAFGRFDHQERMNAGKLVVDEDFTLRMQRIRPEAYADFADFASAVDRAQGRELKIVAAPPAPGLTR
jgi:hypothetical protein